MGDSLEDIIQSLDATVTVNKSVTATSRIWDLSTVTTKVQLNGTLTITPSANQLIGTSTSVQMDWDWTKNGQSTLVDTQTLNEGDGIYDPVAASLRTSTVLNVSGTKTFGVQGDDGLGYNPESTKTLTKTLLFNNYVYKGELAANLSGETEANMVAAIKTLSTEIPNLWDTNGIVDTFTGTGNGGTPLYYYYAFPASWDPSNYFEDPTKTAVAGFFQEGVGNRSGFYIIGTYDITQGTVTEPYKIYQSISNYLDDITFNVKYYG